MKKVKLFLGAAILALMFTSCYTEVLWKIPMWIQYHLLRWVNWFPHTNYGMWI